MKCETLFNPASEVISTIDRGLHNHNIAHIDPLVLNNYHKIAVVARDPAGHIVGGIHGELVWEWLYIHTLWVTETHRGQGVATQLLNDIEAAAVSKGFYNSHLETTDFQALEFYKRNGYEVFGELEGKPTSHTWYYIKKRLR